MAWTTGFFNSVNGDRTYNAEQMSRIFEGLITSGVYAAIGNKMAVQPNSGMTVQIATGRGWFGFHWANNDSEYLQVIEDSDVLMNRYCAVCVRVDDSDSVRNAVPYFKYSDFATNPVKPAMERSELINEYCLAYIYIRAGATEITAADIEDTRGNTDLCGWVTGLIEQVDTKTLYEQYKADWADFMASEQNEADAWQAQQQAEFLEWYTNLQTNLDGDVAATLTSKVQVLETEMDTAQEDINDLKTAMENHVVRSSGTFDGLGWSSNDDGYYTQTITVPGVTADNDIFVTPATEYKKNYINAGIQATAQGEDSVSFRCTDPEDIDIVVDVIIFNF